MTKEEILIKALNNRCKYESNKEMDYDIHLAIIDAMDEYAQQEVKEYAISTCSNSLCCICKNQLTHFDINKNVCMNCGNSPSPTTKINVINENQDAGSGTHFTTKTEKWAFDDPEELLNLINDLVNKSTIKK